jgi:hypothetical protein
MRYPSWRSTAAVLLLAALLAFDGPRQLGTLLAKVLNQDVAGAIEQLLRLTLTVIAVVIVVAGVGALVRAAPGKWKAHIVWIGGTIATLVAITVLYFNAILRVEPTSERLRVGERLLLTASPVTLREFIRGSRSVTWVTSDPLKVQIDTAKTDAPIATAVAPGRVVIFANRGTVRSQARLTVMAQDGSVPPAPCDTSNVGYLNPLGQAVSNGAPRPPRDSTRDSVRAPAPDAARHEASPRAHCIFGSVMSPNGQPLPHARVSLISLAGGRTDDTLWVRDKLTEPSDGRYAFSVAAKESDLDTLAFRVLVSSHEIETKHTWFVPTRWGLDTASRPVNGRALAQARDGSYELDITLPYSTQSSFYLVWFLIPAIVGLLTTVYYRHEYGPLEDVSAAGGPAPPEDENQAKRKRNRLRFLTLGYVGGNALIWGVMIAVFAAAYAFRNIETISLFSPRLSIPILAPTFAFLGVLVYATYSLNRLYPFQRLGQGRAQDNDVNESRRQSALLKIGHRIIAAPYVALMGVLVVGNERGQSNWTIPLVSFFTGLWIEPILRLLRGVGQGLIAAQRTKVVRPEKPGPDAFTSAKLVLDQRDSALRETLGRLTDVTIVDFRVGVRFGANGNGATPVVRVIVRAPDEKADEIRAAVPAKLEGQLGNGTAVSVDTEIEQLPPA